MQTDVYGDKAVSRVDGQIISESSFNWGDFPTQGYFGFISSEFTNGLLISDVKIVYLWPNDVKTENTDQPIEPQTDP